jgi:hypothetical protein
LYCNKKAGYVIVISKRLIIAKTFGVDSNIHHEYVERTWTKKNKKNGPPYLGRPIPQEWIPGSIFQKTK